MNPVSNIFQRLKQQPQRLAKRSAKRLAYDNSKQPESCSTAAQRSARNIRGEHGPSVMIYGVMPRSGTVMLGELLRLHPDLSAFPNDLWEIPFLAETPHISSFNEAFFDNYGQNRERMQNGDLPALFGAAFLRYLLDHVPAQQRLLVKEAGCRYLHQLPAYFPDEQVLLLMRDGRDIVHSTLRTWPSMDFKEVCLEWAMSAETMLSYQQRSAAQGEANNKAWLVRYEDVLADQPGFIRQACETFGLDVDRFDFSQIEQVRVIGKQSVAFHLEMLHGHEAWKVEMHRDEVFRCRY